MLSNPIARILAGSISVAFLLQGCTPSESAESPMAPEAAKPAARVSIPNNLGSVGPWTLSDYETITYYLEGSFSTVATKRAAAVEAFKEWSLVLQDGSSRIRFQETTDINFANIKVSYGATLSGGCVEGTRVRYCNLILPNENYLLKGIGMVMGIPVSATSGDVMYSSTTGSIFSSNDLYAISSKYNLAYGVLSPMFEIPYYNATGTEVVIGWDALRSRTIPGPVYVKKNTYERNLVAAVMSPATAGYWNYSSTFPILTYLKTSNFGSSKYFSNWNYAQFDYSQYDPTYGLRGVDPAPGVLGYAGCAEPSVAPLNSRGSAAELFGFNPEMTWLGGYYSTSKGAPRYGAGTTTPIYFYKDAVTTRYRVSTTIPTTNATCVRLGGYAFAVK